MKKKPATTYQRARDAITGRFIRLKVAKRRPKTTVVEERARRQPRR